MSALVVLNTRPHEQAAELSTLLRQAGFEPLEAPAIEIEPAWDPSEFETARRDLGAGVFEWGVFAAPNSGSPPGNELRTRPRVGGGAPPPPPGVASPFPPAPFH